MISRQVVFKYVFKSLDGTMALSATAKSLHHSLPATQQPTVLLMEMPLFAFNLIFLGCHAMTDQYVQTTSYSWKVRNKIHMEAQVVLW